ncbi:GGDEF domain-containing protein, partial [Alicyclobacillus acidiphilus]
VLVYFVCMTNDSIILQHHRTLYPTSWIGAGLLFLMLWREAHWHMQEVYEYVNLDKFTGAYSRTFGENHLSECLKTQNVGMFYADIDEFKQINDRYGHRTGDMVLKLMMDLVKPMMQSPNLLVRMGGDEFLFLFPQATREDEAILRSQLESLLEGMHIPTEHTNADRIPVSVSLGWAYASRGDSWIDMIHNADLSMYRTKEGNKTRLAHLAPNQSEDTLHPIEAKTDTPNWR